MHDILKNILRKKEDDLAQKKKDPLTLLHAKVQKTIPNTIFLDALKTPKNSVALIAEIKLATPTERFFDSSHDVVARAKVYAQAGVDAISVVTEQHVFRGDMRFVSQIKKTLHTPLLVKDFVIDAYQIYEAKAAGADALLLMAKIISSDKLRRFVEIAKEIGIEPIVEINTEAELADAVLTKADIIGVNARNMDTLQVNIDEACALLQKIPQGFLKLGFSGVFIKEDVEKYQAAGAKGVLVGTVLMKASDIQEAIEELKV